MFLSRIIIFLIFFLLNVQSLFALEVFWKIDKLSKPESVVYHKNSDSIFISNINGDSLKLDGNGYITKIDINGKMIEEKWVDGLDGPKGMAIFKNSIYVSDINKIHKISIDNKKIETFNVNDAGFLNDIAIDNKGNVYASDMFKNRIYLLEDKKVKIWKESKALLNPNGLLVDNQTLIVAPWGKIIEGFKTEYPGHLLKIDIKTKKLSKFFSSKPIGNLDGIVFNNQDGYLATDWVEGSLIKINKKGVSKKILDLNKGSADLEIIMHKNLILIPLMLDNQLLAFKFR